MCFIGGCRWAPMDTAKARKIPLVLSAATAVAVAAILLFSAIGTDTVSVAGTNISYVGYDGGEVLIEGSIVVKSDAQSDLADATVHLYAYSPDTGKQVLVFEKDGFTVRAHDETSLEICQRIPFWTLFNIINSDLTSDGSVLHMLAEVSFGYAFGLVDVGADARITCRLAADGKHVAYSFSDPDPNSITIYVTGLHGDLLPDGTSITITDGTTSLDASVYVQEDGTMCVSASSDSGLDSAIEDLKDADMQTTVHYGTWDPADNQAFLTALHYARQIQ